MIKKTKGCVHLTLLYFSISLQTIQLHSVKSHIFCSHRRCSRMSSVLSSECTEIRMAYIIGDLGLPPAAFCPLTWEMLSPGGVIIINGIRWALLGRMRPRGWEGEVNEEELPCFDAGFFAMAAVAFLQLLHNIHWWWCFLGLQNILHSL